MFVDFACSGCRASLQNAMRTVDAKSQMRLSIRYLTNLHEDSRAFAALAEEASERGVYWKFIQKLCDSEYMPLSEASAALDSMARPGRKASSSSNLAASRIHADRNLCDDLGIWQSPTAVLWHGGQFKVFSSVDLRRALREIPSSTNG